MKRLLMLSAAFFLPSLGVGAQEITVLSFGGAYGAAHVDAQYKPFTAQTGIRINSVDADNPATPLKAMVEAGNVTVDVADLEPADLLRLCDEGALEVLNLDELPAAPNGAGWKDDFIAGGIHECGVGTIVYSTVVAYNADKTKGVSSVADVFDLEKFPGKRTLRKSARMTLELALMADGVPPDQVYEVLGAPGGVERALAKLDTIKNQIVWWEAGAQPPQLLADGEVVFAHAFNGRIFNAKVEENQPFEILWDNQLLDFNLFAIPKGARNKDAAWDFIKFATDTQRLADVSKYISYGPPRKSSAEKVGLFKDGKTEMATNLPTHPAYMDKALTLDSEFWADHDIEISEKFNAWLAR